MISSDLIVDRSEIYQCFSSFLIVSCSFSDPDRTMEDTPTSVFSTMPTSTQFIMSPSNSAFSSPATNATYVSIADYLNTWHHKLRIYSLIVFTLIRIIGNMLSFVVFIKSKLRRTSHGAYLITLAWVDTSILILELLLRTNNLSQSDISCKVFYYIRNTLKMLEAFLVVSLCADRSIFLRFPFQSHKWANFILSIISIVVQTAIACCLCGYTFGRIILHGTRCNVIPNDYKNIYFYTDLAISVIVGEVLTGLIVIVLAVYIAMALSKLRQHARRLSCNRAPNSVIDREVTKMTIAIAVTFSLFRLPYSISYTTYFIRHVIIQFKYTSATQQMLQKAVHLTFAIAQMNYCVNFVIYLIFWGAFRKKLARVLFCGKKDEVRRQSSSPTLTESTGFDDTMADIEKLRFPMKIS